MKFSGSLDILSFMAIEEWKIRDNHTFEISVTSGFPIQVQNQAKA